MHRPTPSEQVIILHAYFEGGEDLEHRMPDTVATTAAAKDQRVLHFNVTTPHGFDGKVEWHTSDSTLGHLEFEDERQTSGWVVSHGIGGTVRFGGRLDGAAGPGQYLILKDLVVTFVPDISLAADVEVDVLVPPATVELDPDPVPAPPPVEEPPPPPPAPEEPPAPAPDPPPAEPPPAGGETDALPPETPEAPAETPAAAAETPLAADAGGTDAGTEEEPPA